MGQPVYDGNTSFLGGQNAGLDPQLIGPTQYATGINTSIKDGTLRPRPGFRDLLGIEILTEGGITGSDGRTRSYKDIFRTGKMQGAAPYIADTGKFIIAIISGIIFRINPTEKTAVVLTVEDEDAPLTGFEPTTQRLDQYADRHYWTEAGKFFVIFDYPDYAIVISGHDARRVKPENYEIPVAAVRGAYNQNRLFVFSAVHEFTASDPVGNQATADAPLTFEEVFAPAAAFPGQSFSLGSTNINNPITAVGFFPRVDGSTEIGPMFVATKKSTYSFQTQLERTSWGASGFGTLVLNHQGIAGQRAFTVVGSDVWFMSGDGHVRSFSVARGDQEKWARTPVDKEVKNWIRFCDKELIQYTVAAYHNNRILFTVNPQITSARDLEGRKVSDISFKGMVVLELDPVSGFMQNGNPAWAGLWLGVNPTEMVELDNELYIFSKDPGSINVLYRVEADEITWDTYNGKQKQIVSRLETRRFDCADQGLSFALKEEVTAYPSVREVAGDFCFHLERRNDSYPNYAPWRTFKHTAPTSFCGCACEEMPTLATHTFRELNMGDPQNFDDIAMNPVTNEELRYFNAAQYRITLTGKSWQMTSFRMKAELQADDQKINQPVNALPVEVVQNCEAGPFELYSTAHKQGVWKCPS